MYFKMVEVWNGSVPFFPMLMFVWFWNPKAFLITVNGVCMTGDVPFMALHGFHDDPCCCLFS